MPLAQITEAESTNFDGVSPDLKAKDLRVLNSLGSEDGRGSLARPSLGVLDQRC